jgi:uncharacterized RDD family membrane protein YckC
MEARHISLGAEETSLRWRDTKRGKFKKKKENKPSRNISPIINRVKAFLTDSFMIFMPITYVVFYLIMGSRDVFRAHMLSGWFYILIPNFIIITLFLYIKGQTPGYKAYNIMLTDDKGGKPALFSLVVRYIIFNISIIIPPFFLITFFTKDKLGIHDILSRTLPQHFKAS